MCYHCATCHTKNYLLGWKNLPATNTQLITKIYELKTKKFFSKGPRCVMELYKIRNKILFSILSSIFKFIMKLMLLSVAPMS
jgi:hypothetical protein